MLSFGYAKETILEPLQQTLRRSMAQALWQQRRQTTPDVREALIANLSAKVKHHMERAVRKRLKRRMSRAEARENAEVALREEDAAQAAKRRLPKSVSSRHSSARRASVCFLRVQTLGHRRHLA